MFSIRKRYPRYNQQHQHTNQQQPTAILANAFQKEKQDNIIKFSPTIVSAQTVFVVINFAGYRGIFRYGV